MVEVLCFYTSLSPRYVQTAFSSGERQEFAAAHLIRGAQVAMDPWGFGKGRKVS